ncbi:MAG: hypothetical protein HQM09_13165 [Candidatus Riflebacteria bacterium]|nr:hypothetical protein [Candidatus Riflebacteria bacterium]
MFNSFRCRYSMIIVVFSMFFLTFLTGCRVAVKPPEPKPATTTTTSVPSDTSTNTSQSVSPSTPPAATGSSNTDLNGENVVSNPGTTSATDTGNSTTTSPTNTDNSTTAGPTGLKYGIEAVDGSSKWTQSQKDEANRILGTLPDSFRSCTKTITRESDNAQPGALGWSDTRGNVWLADCSCDGRSFQGPFVHEMTHNFQGSHPDVMAAWKTQFWASGSPNPSSVSSYGNSSPAEDMAESVRNYWQVCPQLKQKDPARYEFIKKNIMNGVEYNEYHVDN